MRYWIFFVFLIFFSGCSQKNYFTSNKKKINYIKIIKPLKKVENNKSNKSHILLFGHFYMPIQLLNLGLRGNKHGLRTKKCIKVHKLTSKSMKPIKYHSYSIINSEYELKKLKNTITYILFSKNLIGQDKNTLKYKRYAKVLELIQELKKVSDSNSSNSAIDKYENKFILLKNGLSTNKVTVETYNYELSNKLIDFFKEKLPPLFFDQDGPFFITTTDNVFKTEKDFNFIHLDLSTFNNSAINQIINSYKNRLVEKGDSDIEILEEWYYNILSSISNFDNNLHLIQVAIVGDEG